MTWNVDDIPKEFLSRAEVLKLLDLLWALTRETPETGPRQEAYANAFMKISNLSFYDWRVLDDMKESMK